MQDTDSRNARLKAAVVGASRTLFKNGVMSHTGHANLSARVDGETMLLTIDGQVRELVSCIVTPCVTFYTLYQTVVFTTVFQKTQKLIGRDLARCV